MNIAFFCFLAVCVGMQIVVVVCIVEEAMRGEKGYGYDLPVSISIANSKEEK